MINPKTGAWVQEEEEESVGENSESSLLSKDGPILPATTFQLNNIEVMEFSLEDLNLNHSQSTPRPSHSEDLFSRCGSSVESNSLFVGCQKFSEMKVEPEYICEAEPESVVSHCKVLEYFSGLQSLLFQLTVPEIRKDFLNERIVALEDPEMLLHSLDLMSGLLLCASPVMAHNWNSTEMGSHIRLLMVSPSQPFVLPSSHPYLYVYKYSYWNELLRNILVSSYWTRVCKSSDWNITLQPKVHLTSRQENKKSFEKVPQVC